jgi:ElaB/YqjD/DUF883 family membrane-anchored ribosome-binding protein
MPVNKQNSETENTMGGGTSTRQVKDENSAPNNTPNNAPNKTSNPTESSVGKTAPQPATVTESAKDALGTVKDSAGAVASEAMGQAKEKAGSVLGEQKANLASGITSVADSIRQVGENLSGSNENNQVAALAGKYGETLAGQVEKFSSYIDEKDFKELMRDVEQFARRQPLLFVGGAFALGIMAARFLKSSGQRQTARNRSRNQ